MMETNIVNAQRGLKKVNLGLWLFGLLKVPLIGLVRPRVMKLNQHGIVIRIPLRRRTKNHLGCMYFGALAIGADLSGGFLAYQLIRESKQPVKLIFKSLDAKFLKRAEADVYFACESGAAIRELVAAAVHSGEREELAVKVIATTPSLLGDEPIAEFTLVLSLKKKP